jgi:hypothetical protein
MSIRRTESDELGSHNIQFQIPTRKGLFANATICVYAQSDPRIELNIQTWLPAQEFPLVRDLISQVETELNKLEDES